MTPMHLVKYIGKRRWRRWRHTAGCRAMRLAEQKAMDDLLVALTDSVTYD